ncbi:MAG: hypothetical protein CL912_32670 [Deltaproteobacteria bacterium]|nr:hypothetical protein [Deltaproteobacteria bacterium]
MILYILDIQPLNLRHFGFFLSSFAFLAALMQGKRAEGYLHFNRLMQTIVLWLLSLYWTS